MSDFSSVVRKVIRPLSFLRVIALLAVIAAMPANAQIIDRIDINQVGDEAEIQIQFVTRIQYLRQAALKNGDIRLYFNLLEIDALDSRLILETTKSPPSNIVPRFTLTYPELDSSLTVRFSKPVSYHVRPGKDGRSISIFTPVIKPQSEPASKAQPAAPVTVVTPAVAPPVIVSPAIAPPVPVPSVATPPAITPSAAIPLAQGEAAAPQQQVMPAAPPQTEPAGAPPPATPLTPEEIELEAKQLIGSARNSLQAGRIETAIGTLNRLLNLPPNQQSQTAQELIGGAREKNGEFAKARVEYELYLKLYPNAADANQVKERLSQLPKEEAAKSMLKAPAAQKRGIDEKMQVYGSFTQNYYRGDSHTDATVVTNGLSVTTSSLTSVDQSLLISTLDLTGRKRSETTDTRIVLRDSDRANFLPGQKSDNRLNAAYVEQSARDKSYLYRLGRQSGSAGGVPGRYDGAWAGYSLNPAWRINGVIGEPVEFTGGGIETKTFAGISADLTRLPEQWSGSGYLIGQRVGEVMDRQAVGLETRYFDAQRNYLGLLDYDTQFKAVNIAMLQGNVITENGDFLFLLDHRKSPSLQITNALPAQTTQSISALIQSGVSKDSLLADARALSPTSNLIMVGVNRTVSPRVRLGGDFRITNTSGTGAAGVLPASPGTGNIYVYSVQAIGNNLLFKNDLGVVNASYLDAKTFKGRSLSFNQVTTWQEYWRLDLSLQLYSQNDNLGTQQMRLTPNMKVSYRLNDSVSFEAEGGIEETRTNSVTQSDRIRRRYFFIGYRWDFR